MNVVQVSCAAALLFVSVSGYCQRATSGEDCFNKGGQADARECLESRFAQSELDLKKAETSALVEIQNWDELPSFKDRATATLKVSSSQFRHYRKDQCQLQASLAAGGSGTTHRMLLCAIELNEQRISHLKSIRALSQ